MKIVTVFFSLKGETIAPGMKIVKLEKGHTAQAAEFIQQAAGGDLFEIETVKTYMEDHMKMIYEAREELNQGIRPELKKLPEHFEQYDTVFLGYPNWWNTLPMPVVSFLEKLDWTGKRVIPFNTSEGSGLGKSVEWIRELGKGAAAMKAILDGQDYPINLAESTLSKEIANLCPMELTMERSGGHEYYARLPKTVKLHDAKSTSIVYRGGVYYFDAWNALALVFEDADICPYSVHVVGEMEGNLPQILKEAKNRIQIRFDLEDA